MGKENDTAFQQANRIASSELTALRRVVQNATTNLMQGKKAVSTKIITPKDGENGKDGEKGDKGDKGDKGEKGDPGKDGKDGKDGKNGECYKYCK